ncbi:hypothetical protein DFP72DRAFT_931291 [Ephemerocybe angulata]|uniref:Uncharacterized protein n=1 Tax=Ephemerocybe angulata TaxID=980116 RepID=A0A8H6HCF2_9AGAR|nr:hypothetical protein DFP72DRAFT_931291 [Tulosesus angulatus]
MDLPGEIIAEVLSYSRAVAHHSRSLVGLQVGLACKDLYRQFYPAIASYQLDALSKALASRRLTIHVLHPSKARSSTNNQREVVVGNEVERLQERFEAIFRLALSKHGCNGGSATELVTKASELDPKNTFPFDFRLTYSFAPSDDIEGELWSLHSFLSREWAIPRLRRIRLGLQAGRWEDSTTGRQGRAHMKLLQLCMELKGVELEVGEGPPFWADELDRNRTIRYLAKLERSPVFAHELAPLSSMVAAIFQPFKSFNSDVMTLLKRASIGRVDDHEQPLSPAQIARPLTSDAEGSTRRDEWDERSEVNSTLLNPQVLENLNPTILDAKINVTSFCLTAMVPHIHSLMSCSPLTQLHLNGLGLTHHDWNAMFSSWTLPNLKFFKIEHVQIPFSVLMTFLDRHPSIISAALIMFTVVGKLRVAELRSSKLLPRLKTLTAAPPFLLSLFKSGLKLGPDLHSLTISREDKYFPGTLEDITDVLFQISRKGATAKWPSLQTLSFILPYEYHWLEAWLSSFVSQSGRFRPSGKNRGSVFRRNPDHKRSTNGMLRELRHISTLNLTIAHQANYPVFTMDDRSMLEAISDFVAAFPALIDVYMRGHALPAANYRGRVRKPWGDTATAMWNRCDRLERLEFHESGLTRAGCETDPVVCERPSWLKKT